MTGPIKRGDGERPIKHQCEAHKRDGSRCRLSAVHGSTVCHKHGASARQVRDAAARRVSEAAVMRAYERYSLNGHGPEPVNVLDELAAVVTEIARFKDFLGSRLAALSADQWRFDHPDRARVRAEVELYGHALDRTSRVLVEVARLNIDLSAEARAREREQVARVVHAEVGAAVFGVFNRSLSQMSLTEDQWRIAREVFPRELAALSDGATDG